MKSEKRYLVTYSDGSVSSKDASSILGSKNLKEGVEFMATEATPSKDDVLHFEMLGISSLELTEAQVADLSKKEGVLAVEEDVEVFALGQRPEDSQQYSDLFLNNETPELSTLTANRNGNVDEIDSNIKIGQSQDLSQSLIMEKLDFLINRLNSSQGNSGYNSYYQQQPYNNVQTLPPLPTLPRLPIPIPTLPIPFPLPPFHLQPIPWNISQVKAPPAWSRGIRGTGVKVAILDTGIASHPDLSIFGGASFIPGTTSYNDLNGHGTHCAGVVAAKNNILGVVGVAPSAQLYAVKVLNDAGRGSSSGIIAGMEWCIQNNIKVASMSLGGSSSPLLAYASAVNRCQENGVTVVVAAGNEYGTSFPWVAAPANSIISGDREASPIAVGAIDRLNNIAAFSSRGGATAVWNQVTCVAPGVNINSTSLNNGYRVLSGTSMATPHVAGLAAMLIQRYPGITPVNVKTRIASTSTDLGLAGYDRTYGFGLINCDRATL